MPVLNAERAPFPPIDCKTEGTDLRCRRSSDGARNDLEQVRQRERLRRFGRAVRVVMAGGVGGLREGDHAKHGQDEEGQDAGQDAGDDADDDLLRHGETPQQVGR